MQIDNTKPGEVVKAHLEALDPECRWCFAIDTVRVKGAVIETHNYTDATILVLYCPRCGGKFTHYFTAWEGNYVRERYQSLHTDAYSIIPNDQISKISSWIYPEYRRRKAG